VTMTTKETQAKPYSFGVSARLTAEKAALYQEASAEIASRVGVTMKEWLPSFLVETAPLLEADAGDGLVDDYDSYDTVAVIEHGIPGGSIHIELSLALALINDFLGGGSMPIGSVRPLTSIETRVLDLLLDAALKEAGEVLLLENPVLGRQKTDGFVAGKDDQPEALIGFALSIAAPVCSGRMILEFELSVLQAFSDAIDGRLSGRRLAPPSVLHPETAEALQPVPVPLTVDLGRLTLTAGELVSLEPGDVLRARQPVNQPMTASVGEQEIFKVRMGRSGSRLVAEVLAPTGNPIPAVAAFVDGLPVQPLLNSSQS
jgi:flagellar motor switch/type III secretory pathway protein FliN